MSPELIAIIAVGAALLVGLGGLIVTAALWLGGWLRDVDRRLANLGERVARIEGLIERGGQLGAADAPAPAGD
ncbi:MAG: hypothetical protein OXN97_11700 [Bryobacterales bacterium]|nr:hypothetical protein [Bryobacterales bacterium]